MKNKSGLGSGITLFFAVIICIMLLWIFIFLFKGVAVQKAPPIVTEMKDVNSYLIMDNYLRSEVENGDILTLINLRDKDKLKTETAKIMDNFLENKGRYRDICWVVVIQYPGIETVTMNNTCESFRENKLEIEKTTLRLINKKTAAVRITI